LINQLPLRGALFLVALALFALSPRAQAVCREGCANSGNTFLGNDALPNPDVYGLDTAIGEHALYSNTTGEQNTAIGVSALSGNTTGDNNVAVGNYSLASNNGGYNVAIGGMEWNTTGSNNTAVGSAALNFNDSANNNTANGYFALFNNNGNANTAVGVNALYGNTTGNGNIGLGAGAGGALTTGYNNIDIGNNGVAGEAAKIRIGTKGTHKNTYIAGISGATVARGVGVLVDSTGHLGTVNSSARFKEAIKPMDKASEAILALQPVTFRYKHELDPDGIPQFGLVAEQVEKVNPDLVARDDQGKIYTVRYEAVNAMLLNEFLKEHCKVEGLQASFTQQQKDFQATVAQQQKEIKALTASLKEQASQIQKVSDQLELSKPAPRTVVNNQ